MRLKISTPGLRLAPEERDHIEARVRSAFAWPAHVLQAVVVRIRDVNGPRGGVDKACVVRVTLGHGREAVIEDRHADLRQVVNSAIHRSSRLVARMIRRGRSLKRPALRPAHGIT